MHYRLTALLVIGAAALFIPTLNAPAQTRPSAAQTFEVDAAHSVALFRVEHLGVGAFFGRFNQLSGSFTEDPSDSSNSRVELTIAADSIDTNSEKRDQHLKGPDFFNAKQFPELRFVSERVKELDDSTVEVQGKFSMHGVTKTITVKMTHVGSGNDPWGGYRSGYEGSFTIKRSDFGMKYMLKGLSDDVRVTLGIEGVNKKK